VTYVYRCTCCGDFEADQRITEPALTQCPECGHPIHRVPQRIPIHFTGSGYYVTDSGSAKKPL